MRRLLFFLGFCALLGFDTLGQVAFKQVANHTAPVDASMAFFLRLVAEPWVLAIGLAFAGAFVTYMSLMRYAPVGPLFAASHLEIVSVTAVSVFWFHEHLTLLQGLGCATILLGVGILASDGPDSA